MVLFKASARDRSKRQRRTYRTSPSAMCRWTGIAGAQRVAVMATDTGSVARDRNGGLHTMLYRLFSHLHGGLNFFELLCRRAGDTHNLAGRGVSHQGVTGKFHNPRMGIDMWDVDRHLDDNHFYGLVLLLAKKMLIGDRPGIKHATYRLIKAVHPKPPFGPRRRGKWSGKFVLAMLQRGRGSSLRWWACRPSPAALVKTALPAARSSRFGIIAYAAPHFAPPGQALPWNAYGPAHLGAARLLL